MNLLFLATLLLIPLSAPEKNPEKHTRSKLYATYDDYISNTPVKGIEWDGQILGSYKREQLTLNQGSGKFKPEKLKNLPYAYGLNDTGVLYRFIDLSSFGLVLEGDIILWVHGLG